MVEEGYEPLPTRKPGAARLVLIAALVAFIGGAALVGWLAWSGQLGAITPDRRPAPAIDARQMALPAETPAPTVLNNQAGAAPEVAVPSLEARLAMLEERLSRIDSLADASSGNAARAEGLLVAFAARRMIDRGAALGPIAEQLQLRFGDAQPRAVQALIEGAARPVTLGDLTGELDALTAKLEKPGGADDLVGRVSRQLSDLFVIRSDKAPASTPGQRLSRARLLLQGGKVDQAVAEIARLPGAASANGWIARARHYGEMQRALDLIETTAMLEPRKLHDAAGKAVNQPSPLAPEATASAVPEGTF